LQYCEGWKVIPGGAFYFFCDVRKLLQNEKVQQKGVKSDKDFSLYILEKGSVLTIPGSGFSTPGFLRMAYARDMSMIEKGLQSMNDAILTLLE